MSSGTATPVGYQQLTVSSAAVGPTIPAPASNMPGPNCALIRVETAGIRWRDDGTNPTASVGTPLQPGDVIPYYGNLSALKFIRSGATDAVLDITYYIGDVILEPTSAAGVGGDSPSGATDSGNPVKVGGRYNSTQPTLTDGQRGDAQLDTRGNLKVTVIGKDGATAGDVTVQGDVASASADSGNPVKIGGIYQTTKPTFTNLQRGDAQLGSRGAIDVTIRPADSPSQMDINAVAGDSNSNTITGLKTLSYPLAFGATNWERWRNNNDVTTGDTGAKSTGTFNGATQTNYNWRGAVITCLLGTVTGAVTTWQTGLQTSYDGGTTWLGLTPLGANDGTAVSGRTYVWHVYPTNWSQTAGATPANIVPAAGGTQVNYFNAALPRTWRFTATVSVATSIVITAVYVNYIL